MKKKFAVLTLGMVAALSVFSLQAKSRDVGKPAPDFKLADIDGKEQSLSQYKGKYVVLEWINYGCPFIKKHYNSGNMQKLQAEMKDQDVVWLSICSSAEGKQGFMSAPEWKKATEEHGSKAAAVLLDPTGRVGKLYGAKTTPHMFIIDPKGVLIYKGAIDDKPDADLESVPGAKNYVRAALDEAKAGKKVSVSETQSYGCGVKYK